MQIMSRHRRYSQEGRVSIKILKLAQNQRRYVIWAICHNPPGNILFKLPPPETYAERKARKRRNKAVRAEYRKWYVDKIEREANEYGFSFKTDFTFKAVIPIRYGE